MTTCCCCDNCENNVTTCDNVTMGHKCDHVTSVTTCDKCDHMWQVWPHVTMWPWVISVTTFDNYDHIWKVWPHVTSVVTVWTYGHHGHMDIIDIWISWIFGHHDSRIFEYHGYLNIMDIWISLPINIWNIAGRRFLRTFPSCYIKCRDNITT